MNQVIAPSSKQTILFDNEYLSEVTSQLFSSQHDNSNTNTLGRGSVYFFEREGRPLVLRHYRRGGMIRHCVKDNYLYTGLASTRMWREFNLLQKLVTLGLPVPKPVAVRCTKTSFMSYQGDLITEQIANAQTLGEYLCKESLETNQWESLGRLLSRFHFSDVYHADLNANNIMLDTNGQFYVIDFDRCEIRQKSSSNWKEQNLQRLLRSFLKLKKLKSTFYFDQSYWQFLLEAYTEA